VSLWFQGLVNNLFARFIFQEDLAFGGLIPAVLPFSMTPERDQLIESFATLLATPHLPITTPFANPLGFGN